MNTFFKNAIYVCCIIVSLALAYFIIVSKSYKSNYIDVRMESILYKTKLERHKENIKLQLSTENTFLDSIVIENTGLQEISIASLLNRPKLIYRYFPETCITCVNKDIESLNELGRIIGFENIIILSAYPELRMLKVFIAKHNIKSPCFNYAEKLNLSMENDTIKKGSFCLIAKPDQRIQFSYKIRDDQSLNAIYFERIKHFFERGY